MSLTPALLIETAAVLHALLAFDRPADAVLSAHFRAHPHLGRHDRAFIAETAYGVLRRLRSLEHLSGGRSPRRLLRAWLARYGGHNLREFDGVIEAEEAGWLREVKSADLTALPPAVRLELPDWLYAALSAQYGEDLEALAEALNRPAPLDLRINPLRTTREAALEALARDGLGARPTPWSPLGLRLMGKPALQRHPLFAEGSVEVQDEGSQLLGFLLAPRRGEMVCDFCAGAGGKTLLLGALMRSTGRLYAFDVSAGRLAKFKPRLARSGLSNVHPQRIADERDAKLKRLAGKFDRVLADVPCSGLGSLRRNPDLKWRQTPADLVELTARQAAILEAAARLVKPGGRLVYATCSLLAAENEDIAAAFAGRHPEFRPLDAGKLLAEQKIVLETGATLRLDPVRHGTDGFFAAAFERA